MSLFAATNRLVLQGIRANGKKKIKYNFIYEFKGYLQAKAKNL
jgi:hypothetical protein